MLSLDTYAANLSLHSVISKQTYSEKLIPWLSVEAPKLAEEMTSCEIATYTYKDLEIKIDNSSSTEVELLLTFANLKQAERFKENVIG